MTAPRWTVPLAGVILLAGGAVPACRDGAREVRTWVLGLDAPLPPQTEEVRARLLRAGVTGVVCDCETGELTVSGRLPDASRLLAILEEAGVHAHLLEE